MRSALGIHAYLSLARLAKLLGLVMACALLQAEQPVQLGIPQRGIVPNGSYALSDMETIDTTNGNVSLRIPITSLPAGRGGFSQSLDLHYNSSIYTDFVSSSGENSYLHTLTRSNVIL